MEEKNKSGCRFRLDLLAKPFFFFLFFHASPTTPAAAAASATAVASRAVTPSHS